MYATPFQNCPQRFSLSTKTKKQITYNAYDTEVRAVLHHSGTIISKGAALVNDLNVHQLISCFRITCILFFWVRKVTNKQMMIPSIMGLFWENSFTLFLHSAQVTTEFFQLSVICKKLLSTFRNYFDLTFSKEHCDKSKSQSPITFKNTKICVLKT